MTNKNAPAGRPSTQGANKTNHLDDITRGEKMPEEISELVGMQKRYKEFYVKDWILWISENGVHMAEDKFFEVFGDYNQKDRGCDIYPTEYSTTVDGVKFYCIGG